MNDRSRVIIDDDTNEIISAFVPQYPLITIPCIPLYGSVREYDRVMETDETTAYLESCVSLLKWTAVLPSSV